MTENSLPSFAPGGLAVVVGASGGIGAALLAMLRASATFTDVIGLSRSGGLDVTNEVSIAAAAARVEGLGLPLRLVIVASGILHEDGMMPEKSWRELHPDHLARQFAVNAVGPALLMKHFLPLLAADGKTVFAALSARVGSLGDNHLGGWYGYRAAKAALNQFVRTAAIELGRRRKQAICVALHPGTVESALSAPFAKSGLAVRPAAAAAADLLAVIDGLSPTQSGGFFDHRGDAIPY